MISQNSMGFTEFMRKTSNDLRERFRNSDRRQKSLYIVCLITFIIILTAIIIIIFSLNSHKSDKYFDEFNKECVKSHNYYRSLHGVQPLIVDPELIRVAKDRADYLVSTDVFEHPTYLFNYGENLHYISPSIKKYPCLKVVKPWYDEIQGYNYIDWRQSKGKIGHFTQVVWKSTTKVGCAQAYSQRSRRLYTVCNYSPPGNYVNRYKDNVLLPLPTI